jgi:uncharacterized protein (DUF305 family)
MENKGINQSILYGVIGLLLGVVLAGYAANTNNESMMQMMGMNKAHKLMEEGKGMDMSMSAMSDSLKEKSGDDFDKAFITQMITHHQGAILMAGEAKQKAKHAEIKTMADAIIAAQSSEITQMKGWYKSWYGKDLEIEDVNPNAPMMH